MRISNVVVFIPPRRPGYVVHADGMLTLSAKRAEEHRHAVSRVRPGIGNDSLRTAPEQARLAMYAVVLLQQTAMVLQPGTCLKQRFA